MQVRIVQRSILTLTLLLAGLGTASAQDLDGTWLKARVVARMLVPKTTEAVGANPNPNPNPLTQKPKKRVVKQTAYLSLRGILGNGSGGEDTYFVDVWTEIGGELVLHASGSFVLTPKGVIRDLSFALPVDSDGGEVVLFASALAKAKTDGNGDLKRVRLRTFGGRSTGVMAGETLHGSVRMRAKSVPAASLPPLADI